MEALVDERALELLDRLVALRVVAEGEQHLVERRRSLRQFVRSPSPYLFRAEPLHCVLPLPRGCAAESPTHIVVRNRASASGQSSDVRRGDASPAQYPPFSVASSSPIS